MNENEIIVSEYHWIGIAKLVFTCSFACLFAILVTLATIFGNDWSTQLLCLLLTVFVYYVLYAKIFQEGIIRMIIIYPERLELIYWLKNAEAIDYTDIKAIKNLRNRTRSGDSTGSLKQEMVLSNDEIIDYSETEFVNYHEMKNAIWNYRLQAFSRLQGQTDAAE